MFPKKVQYARQWAGRFLLSQAFLTAALWGRHCPDSILQIRKLRLREVKHLSSGGRNVLMAQFYVLFPSLPRLSGEPFPLSTELARAPDGAHVPSKRAQVLSRAGFAKEQKRPHKGLASMGPKAQLSGRGEGKIAVTNYY